MIWRPEIGLPQKSSIHILKDTKLIHPRTPEERNYTEA